MMIWRSICYNQACIKDVKSPSSMDEQCSGLRSIIASTQNETVHLFDESNKYATTCFPEFDGINENPKGNIAFKTYYSLIFHPQHLHRNAFYFVLFKGWCTTRHAGVRENSRPDATNGWCFCSTDPSQENCNGEIKTKAWLAWLELRYAKLIFISTFKYDRQANSTLYFILSRLIRKQKKLHF